MLLNRTYTLLALLLVSCAKEKSPLGTPASEYTFNTLNLTSPPYGGTIWVTGDIITADDPSLFESQTYSGTGERTMFDRRNGGGWVTLRPHLFPTSFSDGLTTEIQINPEFTLEEATLEAAKYAFLIGQLPTRLRRHVETVWIHKGEEAYGGGNSNILIHTGMTTIYENHDTGIVEETLIHEAAHTSLDAYFYPGGLSDGKLWDAAVAADNNYISNYAEDHPYREDIAELFPMYIAVKYFPDRISNTIRDRVLSASLNRILLFDDQNMDLSLYEQ